MDDNLREAMDRAYAALDARRKDILRHVKDSGPARPLTYGYFAGHYWPDGRGDYRMDRFPIPVISLEGLCDIEIDFEFTGITAKLPKQAAIGLDHAVFEEMAYTVYGVEDYQTDYKSLEESPDILPKRLKNSREAAFFYSFLLAGDGNLEQIPALVMKLEQLGFYY